MSVSTPEKKKKPGLEIQIESPYGDQKLEDQRQSVPGYDSSKNPRVRAAIAQSTSRTKELQKQMSPKLRRASSHDVSQMNFRKWLLNLTSIANLILGPMIIFMGYQIYRLKIEIIVADRALMGMGFFVFLLSIFTIVGSIRNSNRIYIFLFYSNIIMIIFLSTFAIGGMSFSDDFEEWTDKNWYHIRSRLKGIDMDQFKKHINSEVMSLGAFAMTVDLIMMVSIGVLIRILTWKRIVKQLFPVINLIIFVLSTCIIAISVYSKQHSSYTTLPTWINTVGVFIGLFWAMLGVYGYWVSMKQHITKAYLILYIVLVSLLSLLLLLAGAGFVYLSSESQRLFHEDWPNISKNLQKAGYDIEEKAFISHVETNFKFAGLFSIIFVIFLLIALFPATYKLRYFKDFHQKTEKKSSLELPSLK
mmetsp:Transcript_34994/g.39691  ORF Transcript_34994/g.39691 Transcript_34994/m.39691 type:complete len:417 (+) Transcript_34994:207-1457(+)